jgi:mono/diheme cytochrome c family protein
VTGDAALAQNGAVAQGRAAFQRVCNRCHPNGEEDIGPRLINLGWSEARVRRQVRSGHGRMRAISVRRLPDPELDALIAYLRTIGTVR